jgi:uncharacterized membrane protein YbhN (UPF0104 family)
MIGALSRSPWIRATITVAVLAFLLSRIDAGQTLRALGRLDLLAAASVIGLLVIDRAVMIGRWVILLRAAGQPIAWRSAVWIHLVSSFVGAFLPAGVGGDLARVYSLTERTAQGSAAVASVALDRLLGLLSLVIVGFLGLAFAGATTAAGSGTVLTVAFLLVCVGTAATLWADTWTRVALPEAWQASRPGVRVLRLADAVAIYRGRRRAILVVLGMSVAVQILRIAQAYLLGRGIGIPVPFTYYLLFMPAGLIALMLPISVSGFGAPQGLIVWLLKPQGVPEADAFALSTLIVLSGMAANLPGAWLYSRRGSSGTPASV